MIQALPAPELASVCSPMRSLTEDSLPDLSRRGLVDFLIDAALVVSSEASSADLPGPRTLHVVSDLLPAQAFYQCQLCPGQP